jgi:hypothetical protein
MKVTLVACAPTINEPITGPELLPIKVKSGAGTLVPYRNKTLALMARLKEIVTLLGPGSNAVTTKEGRGVVVDAWATPEFVWTLPALS